MESYKKSFSSDHAIGTKGSDPYLLPMERLRGILILALLLVAASCQHTPVTPKPPVPEPYFKPGEYGGDAMSGTEWITAAFPSPDGQKIALIRYRTPKRIGADPTDQLWIVNKDGSNPELIVTGCGHVSWSPDGTKIAFNYFSFPNTYVFVIDLNTMNTTQLNGMKNQYFNKGTVTLPIWFQDGNKLLLSVWATAYQQTYKRGFYIVDMKTDSIQGPLVTITDTGQLGDDENYITGVKYTSQTDTMSGNYIRYDLATKQWHWITHVSDTYVKNGDFFLSPSPTSTTIVYSIQVDNALQLFVTDSSGTNARQLTKLGGEYPNWSPDGSYFTFSRDIHKGTGAHYIMMKCTVPDFKITPLWPDLPDSVPTFPPLSTQHPIDLYSIVQQNK